jgi:predicted O-methyltransferase YrrM
MRTQATQGVFQYISELFAEETPALITARDKGETLVPGMQISPYEGKLLAMLVAMSGARHILEIGSFVGYSTLWMAGAMPDDGTLVTLEHASHHAQLTRAHAALAGLDQRITVEEGEALPFLEGYVPPPGGVDLMFLDAAKREYPDYLSHATRLLCPGGLLVADNTLLFGHMIGEPQKNASQAAIEGMRCFNTELAASKLFQTIMLPTEEGMLIARKLP